ncbi:Tyrosine kinase catalytic domain protein [Ceratobasidium sp. AG-Ba]|nr:Tyrosine kinase catalytic domain protein [Ceratobasidium sp. AG-Ba]
MASRRGESSELQLFARRDRHLLDEGELSAGSGPSLTSTPIEKRGKWRQTFSLKGKGKERADIRPDSPLSPTTPFFPHNNLYVQTLAPESPSPTEISDTDTIRPDTFRSQESLQSDAIRRPVSVMDSYVVVDTKIEDGWDSDSSYVLVSQRKDGQSLPSKRRSNRGGSSDISASNLIPKPKAGSIKGSLKLPAIRTKVSILPTPVVSQTSRSRETEDPEPVPPAPTQTHQIPIPPVAVPNSPENNNSTSAAEVPRPSSAEAILSQPSSSEDKNEITSGSALKLEETSLKRSTSPSGDLNPTAAAVTKPQLRVLIDTDPTNPSEPTPSCKNPPIDAHFQETTESGRLLRPIWTGGLFDLYRQSKDDGSVVAIKMINFDIIEIGKEAQEWFRDWSKCEHVNVVKLMDVHIDADSISLVYPWTENGNIRDYVIVHPDIDRFQLCTQVCQGLSYLHQTGIVHCSIQASNVLISEDGIPMLTDVGLVKLKAFTHTYTNAMHLCAPRWLAPEILRCNGTYSMASDVYALGMTILEIISNRLPFYDLDDCTFLSQAIFGTGPLQPGRPVDCLPIEDKFSSQLWNLLKWCWLLSVDDRPNAATTAKVVEMISYKRANTHASAARPLTRRPCADFIITMNSSAEPIVAPPRLLSPTRSRFASEDRIGEAQFYPGGSPTPRMSRRSDDYQQQYYHRAEPRYVEEPESYAEPEPVPVVPAKKKSKWKQIFSRKKKGKGKASTNVEPLPPLAPSVYTDRSSLEPPPPMPAAVAPSETSTGRRYQLSDPGPVRSATAASIPRQPSVAESREESLRASEAAKHQNTTIRQSVEQTYYQERGEGSFVTQGTESILDPGPPVMLVDEKTGNRVPREVSFASNQTGSRHPSLVGAPAKKKRSLGGTLKRLFSRKKKVPPLVIPPPEQPPPVSHFVEIEDSHPLPPPPPAAAVYSSPPSAVPAVTSPRSSHSHRSLMSPPPDVVVPVSTRASSPVVTPIRRETAPSVVSSTRSIPVQTSTPVVVAAPARRGTASSVGTAPVRRGTGSSASAAPKRRATGSSFGVGRRNTGSSVGTAPPIRPVVAPPPPLSKVTGSLSPSIHSVNGDRSWGEIHVPPEPSPIRTPITSTRPTVGAGLGLGRAGMGFGTRAGLAHQTPRVARPLRTYTAPPPRSRYVHVPRPIPPPPRYAPIPTTTTTTRAGTEGMEAQVQLIVTALRDLAEEHRRDRAVAEARLQEERDWSAAERERDAELRAIVMQLASSRATRGGPRIGEFGERVVRTESEVVEEVRSEFSPGLGTTEVRGTGTTGLGTARLAGLGVGGSDIERLLEIMRQGHEVTMQTYRDMIERWRADIEASHQKFLNEQEKIRARRERKREKPIHWQPGVNMW